MKEYAIIELENGSKYAVIDTMEKGIKKYFLVAVVSNDEKVVDNEFKVCIYNEYRNYFEKIENEEEYDLIMSLFEERLEQQKELDDTLENINNAHLIKLKIINIDGYNYTLEDERGNSVIKNIEFYIENKPKIGGYIYMSEKVIKEKNIFTYGKIYDYKSIKADEIIKIETNEEKLFLQRYYG